MNDDLGDLERGRSESVVKVYNALHLEDASLLRAVPLANVLRCAGCVLGSAPGTSDTYNLSFQATRIDNFISHNWSVPRAIKFLTLALHFEILRAALLTFAVVTTITILTALGMFPIIEAYPHGVTGIMATVCGAPVFLLSLTFGGHIWSLIGCKGPRLFLDKACIHQTDQDIKRRGIESLGAFLSMSSRMVAVFGDEYLQKLWTVYELATYLTLGSSSRIVLCPLFMTKMVLIVMVLNWGFWLILRMGLVYLEDTVGVLIVQLIVVSLMLLVSLGIFRAFRAWSRNLVSMQACISGFDTTKAKCFDEGDRPLVNGIIVAFMKSLGRCQEDAEDGVALQAFDALVRKEVPPALRASVGKVGLRYRYVLAMSQTTLWVNLDRVGGMLQQGAGAQKIFAYLILNVLYFFTLNPLFAALFSWMARRCQRLNGFKDWCFSFVIACILGFAWTCVNFSIATVVELAAESPIALVCSSALLCSLAYVTCRVYKYDHHRFVAIIHSHSTKEVVGCALAGHLPSLDAPMVDGTKSGEQLRNLVTSSLQQNDPDVGELQFPMSL